MDSVGDDVCRKPRIGEHFADDARIAMIQRPHRVKRVGGVPRARSYSGTRRIQIGIGMSQADADTSPRSFRNHVPSAFEFRRNGQHANVTARRLPETIETRAGWATGDFPADAPRVARD